MFEKIPGNVQEDSGECLKRFRGMFQKIPGNVQEDTGTLTNPELTGLKDTLCILLRLKSRSVKGASHHPVFMGGRATISYMVFIRAYPKDEFSFAEVKTWG